MSNTDPDDLYPTLIERLRAELRAVRPPHAEPRYTTTAAPIRAWRLAPLVLAIALSGILALTAFAATGSPNPAVWTNRVESVINPPSPESEPTQAESPETPTAPPAHRPSAPPTEAPEPASSPEHESPEPSDGHESPNPSPSPSSSPPGDH